MKEGAYKKTSKSMSRVAYSTHIYIYIYIHIRLHIYIL